MVCFKYICVSNDDRLPHLRDFSPYKALVIIEEDCDQDWQNSVSDWLVTSGCLYMLAWGQGCSSWDDSVDMANIAAFDFKDIPEDKFIMTTWHDNETIEEFFEFAKLHANHPTESLENVLIFHISSNNDREDEFKKIYETVA